MVDLVKRVAQHVTVTMSSYICFVELDLFVDCSLCAVGKSACCSFWSLCLS